MTAMFRQRCFAAMANDVIRDKSSSGGAFTLFAREILLQNGAVCGAVLDREMKCSYRVVTDESELGALRGSKYVKASLSAAVLAEMRRVLEASRPLLFVGTPCQVAAVKRLFQKDAEDLILVDLVCNGAPRPELFHRYLDENWGRSNVAEFEFRNKARGWRFGHALVHVTLKDGKEIWRDSAEDEYMQAMSAKYSLCEGCFNCPYATTERVGDITLCDFWHVEPRWDDGKGTSGILLNSEKGFAWFCGVRNAFARVEEFPVSYLVAKQPRLRSRLIPRVGIRTFRSVLKEGRSLRQAVERAKGDISRFVAILNFHWETTNFGAVLTAYALNHALNGMGYEARNIDFKPDLPRVVAKPANAAFEEFRRRHLPTTEPMKSIKELRGLNVRYGSFLVGSDQVWNPKLTGWFRDVYWLSFVKSGRRRISVAASFGCDPIREYGRRTLRRLLGAFDAVSVREPSAATELRGIGVPVAQVADPVFLLARDEWMGLVPPRPRPAQMAKPVWYVVNRGGEQQVMDYLGKQSAAFRMQCRRLDAHISIEDWLDGIAHASLVIADSFHAICFALIFARPFVAIGVGGEKMERLRGLLARVGLADRFFVSADEMPSAEKLMVPIDALTLERALDGLRDDLRAYLSRSLAAPAEATPLSLKSRRRAIIKHATWALFACARRYARLLLTMGKAMVLGLLGRDQPLRLSGLVRREAEFRGYKAAFRRSIGELLRMRKDGRG